MMVVERAALCKREANDGVQGMWCLPQHYSTGCPVSCLFRLNWSTLRVRSGCHKKASVGPYHFSFINFRYRFC